MNKQSEVLRNPFNVKIHKETFINYLEVIINPDGVIEYAVPSHIEKVYEKYMEKPSSLYCVYSRNSHLRHAADDACRRSAVLGYWRTY